MPEPVHDRSSEVDTMCTISLKQAALKTLKPISTLRALILSEPDYLPRMVAFGKIETWVQLLYREAGAWEADDRLLVRQA